MYFGRIKSSTSAYYCGYAKKFSSPSTTLSGFQVAFIMTIDNSESCISLSSDTTFTGFTMDTYANTFSDSNTLALTISYTLTTSAAYFNFIDIAGFSMASFLDTDIISISSLCNTGLTYTITPPSVSDKTYYI
jgi:hypothetical protein